MIEFTSVGTETSFRMVQFPLSTADELKTQKGEINFAYERHS